MKTLIIDGLSGTGKWVVSRMCCAIKGVENLSVDDCFELAINSNYVTPNKNFYEILELYLRVYNYTRFIGREVNIRKTDFTYLGHYPFKQPHQIARKKEGIIPVLNDSESINIIETHGGSLCGLADYLKNFNESIVLCKVKRDPAEILLRWCDYINRYGTDPAEFTYCLNYKKRLIPWFVKDLAGEYINAKTNLEKVTIVFLAYSSMNSAAIKKVQGTKNFVEVEYDEFVTDPLPALKKIMTALGSKKIRPDVYKKIGLEMEVPRALKWEEKGYWKLKSNSDLKSEFNAMRPAYKKLLNDFLEDHSKGNIYI